MLALRVDAARLDQHVLGLAAIGAGVHAQRAADGAGNAAQECEPGDAGLLRRPRDASVQHRRAGAMRMPSSTVDLAEAAAEPDHDAGHAAVAHDQVGAEPDDGHRNVGGQARQERGEIVLVRRQEQHLRRPADAEPGELGQRLVGEQPAAQLAACAPSDRASRSHAPRDQAHHAQRLQARPAAHRPIA